MPIKFFKNDHPVLSGHLNIITKVLPRGQEESWSKTAVRHRKELLERWDQSQGMSAAARTAGCRKQTLEPPGGPSPAKAWILAPQD
jgi:hypothetical protein